jgi:putative transposase
VVNENEVEIKALEIMADHVHIFISFDPRQPLHGLIRHLKDEAVEY